MSLLLEAVTKCIAEVGEDDFLWRSERLQGMSGWHVYRTCRFCALPEATITEVGGHAYDCPGVALLTALKGEDTPS